MEKLTKKIMRLLNHHRDQVTTIRFDAPTPGESQRAEDLMIQASFDLTAQLELLIGQFSAGLAEQVDVYIARTTTLQGEFQGVPASESPSLQESLRDEGIGDNDDQSQTPAKRRRYS